jgi:hypothetical protein
MIDALINAFEMANTEILLIAMPEAVIKDVSTALLRRWNCAKSEIVGKPLMKFGTGLVSARHLPPASDANAVSEVTSKPFSVARHGKTAIQNQFC